MFCYVSFGNVSFSIALFFLEIFWTGNLFLQWEKINQTLNREEGAGYPCNLL
jgi:hypothetical protein